MRMSAKPATSSRQRSMGIKVAVERMRGFERDFESPMAGRHIHRPTIGAIMPWGSTEYRARETSGSLRQARQSQSAGCDRL